MGWRDMSLGKILAFAAVGVGAVAIAPFTGGGSLLAAASLGTSLAGAGALATGAGMAGAAVGAALSVNDADKKREQEKNIARISEQANKSKKVVEEHEKHTNIILALTALGCAMANADGEISPEEIVDLNEFVGGLASQGYPTHIREQISEIISNPPTFNEAIKHLNKVDSVEYPEIRNFLVMIMEADDNIHKKEEAFLKAFDIKVTQLTKQ